MSNKKYLIFGIVFLALGVIMLMTGEEEQDSKKDQ